MPARGRRTTWTPASSTTYRDPDAGKLPGRRPDQQPTGTQMPVRGRQTTWTPAGSATYRDPATYPDTRRIWTQPPIRTSQAHRVQTQLPTRTPPLGRFSPLTTTAARKGPSTPFRMRRRDKLCSHPEDAPEARSRTSREQSGPGRNERTTSPREAGIQQEARRTGSATRVMKHPTQYTVLPSICPLTLP